ncbi:hypothetical protein [Okeania sp. SIO3B5]|nr:hypothetical protein [Okeania sp. SIO3B5]
MIDEQTLLLPTFTARLSRAIATSSTGDKFLPISRKRAIASLAFC